MDLPHVKLSVGPKPAVTRLEINGEDVSHQVDHVSFDVGLDGLARVSVRYVCQVALIEGQQVVQHICPLRERDLCPECQEYAVCDADCSNPLGRDQEQSDA